MNEPTMERDAKRVVEQWDEHDQFRDFEKLGEPKDVTIARDYLCQCRQLRSIREASPLTEERREYITKVRNCLPFVNIDGGVQKTQGVIDELLTLLDSATAELAAKTEECERLRQENA